MGGALRAFRALPHAAQHQAAPTRRASGLEPLLAAHAAEMRGALAGRSTAPPEARAAHLATHPAA